MTDKIGFNLPDDISADLHRDRAARIFVMASLDVSAEQRRFAKLVDYPDLYATSHRWPGSSWLVVDSMSQLIEDRSLPLEMIHQKSEVLPPPGSKLLHRLLGRV